MDDKRYHNILILFTTFSGILLLYWWMQHDPVSEFGLFVPGLDNRPKRSSSQGLTVEIGSFFTWFGADVSPGDGNWPRFRGIDYDNISKENVRLRDNLAASPPVVCWSVELGEGHAGPVVADGRVFIMDYDEKNRRDLLRCFSFENGKEIWQRGYDIFIKRNHGMSRTVPAVKNNYVVTMGPMCHVMCVNADSGKFKWGIDLVREYETEVPLWYTGQCPLIDDSIAVIGVGGTALMIGVHCETGDVIWETPNPSDLKMSHASIIPMNLAGERVYVYSALGALVGVSAEKETAGQILFEAREWNHAVVAPSPVYAGNDHIFVTAGYGAGSMLLKVTKESGVYAVSPVSRSKPDEGLASEQQTPIMYRDHMFAIMPKDAGALRNQFVCCKTEDPSAIRWSSGKTNRYGLGPYLIADDKFFILSDDGVLTVAEASTKEFKMLSQTKILEGQDAWGPMAVVNGHLLARDSRELVCLDLTTSN